MKKFILASVACCLLAFSCKMSPTSPPKLLYVYTGTYVAGMYVDYITYDKWNVGDQRDYGTITINVYANQTYVANLVSKNPSGTINNQITGIINTSDKTCTVNGRYNPIDGGSSVVSGKMKILLNNLDYSRIAGNGIVGTYSVPSVGGFNLVLGVSAKR